VSWDLIVAQLVKIFTPLMEPEGSTVSTRTFHKNLPRIRSFHSISSQSICLISILTLSSHIYIGVLNDLPYSSFPFTVLYWCIFINCCENVLNRNVALNRITTWSLVVWNVSSCSNVEIVRCFRGPYCLHHHRPDDGGSMYLWNVGKFQRDYTALHPRRL
jgi:hypothetical protein